MLYEIRGTLYKDTNSSNTWFLHLISLINVEISRRDNVQDYEIGTLMP